MKIFQANRLYYLKQISFITGGPLADGGRGNCPRSPPLIRPWCHALLCANGNSLWKTLWRRFCLNVRLCDRLRAVFPLRCANAQYHQCRINNSSKCSNCYGPRTVARKFLIRGLCVSAGGLWVCAGGLTLKKLTKPQLIY